MSSDKNAPAKTVEEIRKERTLGIALGEGIKLGALGAFVGTIGSLYGTYRVPQFNKVTSISVRTSFPMMMMMFGFGLNYELTMYDCQRFPEKYGLAQADIEKGKVLSVPIHHKLMNRLYDHPFGFIILAGAPFAGFILKQQMKLTHLTLSQRLMQTRVFAQMGILTIALTTMGFREYMDKRGKFPEVDDERMAARFKVLNSKTAAANAKLEG